MRLPNRFLPIACLAVLLGALPTGLRAATPAAASGDTLEAVVLADREDTRRQFREDPMSPLATIVRHNFPPAGAWLAIGAAPDNDIVLPDSSVSAHHVRAQVHGEGFHVEAVDPGASFAVKDRLERTADVPPSAIGVGRYKVRLSYQSSPAVIVFDPGTKKQTSFEGPTWYAYDPRWRFVVPLAQESKADTVRIESTNSAPRPALRVGRFTVKPPGGGTVRLAAYRLLEPGVKDGDLSVFFMDATNGHGSYHGGRYIDVEALAGGSYRLDFNRAYNPSCAYSPHYNCPIPPAENRLKTKIPVGESYAAEGH